MLKIALPISMVIFLSIFCSGCSDDDHESPAVYLQELSISTEVSELPVGLNTQMTAIGYYSDGHNSDLTDEVTWTSDNSSIATINNGLVEGISSGKVNFSAKYDGFESQREMSITEAILQSIALEPETNSVPLGLEAQYSAIGTFSDNNTHDITLHSHIRWISTEESVATVDPLTGKADLITVGNTQISVAMDGINSNVTLLTVTDAVQLSLWVTPETAIIPVGLAQQFTGTVYYSNDSEHNINEGPNNWYSDNYDVLRHENNGLFRAESIGSATVFAAAGETSSNNVYVEVVHQSLDYMTMWIGSLGNPTDVIWVNEPEKLYVSATFTGGKIYDISDFNQISWQSSDIEIADVTLDGYVRPYKEGTVTITATAKYITGRVTKEITVLDR
ncbi:Ig-like domain-containing protein [Shewanella sp. 125m-7]